MLRSLRLNQAEVIVAVCGLLLVFTFGVLIVRPVWQFEKRLRQGMSKAEVAAAVGQPSHITAVGEALPRWGNAPSRVAPEGTWIYFIFPESQHRFVLTFEGDRLSSVDHQHN